MKRIDQNIAYNSLEKALVPKPNLLDGRSERDRLRFLVDFSSVINFYNSNNETHDNWTPFLLKDPVFLLAYISKINKEKQYAVFKKIRNLSQEYLNDENENEKTLDIINQLFLQLVELFLIIENWTHYMAESELNYQLKKYVFQEIHNRYAGEFWALLDLHQYLTISNQIGAISIIKYSLETVKRNVIWKNPKSKETYWEILELNHPLDTNTRYDYYQALVNLGDRLFTFYNKVVDHAAVEFNRKAIHKDEFPDTLLLRAFTRLMMIQQEQLNAISNKHLAFYYSNILKQGKLKAVPDQVFVVAELAKKDSLFDLEEGTLFAAGKTQDNKDINFKSLASAELNPANILNSYTLLSQSIPSNKDEEPSTLSSLYLEKISDPGAVKKNEDGLIKAWNTFGASIANPTNQTSLGLGLSSPLLYLKEGKRKVTITLGFSNEVETNPFRGANFYLSTATEWLNITGLINWISNSDSNSQAFTLEFTLDESFPAIEKFNAESKEMKSDWPILKIEFTEFLNLESPPLLSLFDIEVDVHRIKQLVLANDFGGLSAKNPFQLLGPTPSLGSNFYIGSAEIFSKPLKHLEVKVEWDDLPVNFGDYFAGYNDFFNCFKPKENSQKKMIKTGEDGQDKAESEDQVKSESTTETSNEIVRGIPNDVSIEEKGKSFIDRFDWAIKFRELYSDFKDFYSDSFFDKLFKGKFNFGILGKWLGEFSKLFTLRLNMILAFLKKLFSLKGKKDENGNPDEEAFQYSNLSFEVGFKILSKNKWQEINVQNIPAKKSDLEELSLKDGATSSTLMFNSDVAGKALSPKSKFKYRPISGIPNTKLADPNLQNGDLIFTEESSAGFINMTLDSPEYGFGSSIYGQVVSYIALYNATIVAQKPPILEDLKAAPAIPYIPKVKKISANYKASTSYKLDLQDGKYPLQCFYYSLFRDYLVYDMSRGAPSIVENIGFSLGSPHNAISQLPVYPSFQNKGGMFIELDANALPGKMNLYFELAQNTKNLKRSKEDNIEYNYLSKTGWKALTIFSDSTNGFSCSGIIVADVPGDISENYATMPSGSFWLFIGVKNDPDSYSNTVLLKVNGIELERVEVETSAESVTAHIKSGTITSPVAETPQIASVTQPFPSFGGKPMETTVEMNRRVATRLRSKDRALTHQDFYQIVLEQFPSIFFVKTYLKAANGNSVLNVLVLRKFASYLEANAFNPLISQCKAIEIEEMLTKIASPFTQIEVSNFTLIPVTVIAEVEIGLGFAPVEVKDNIKNLLNVFLSPWIESEADQIKVDRGLKASEVSAFIQAIPGVVQVKNLSLKTWDNPDQESIELQSPADIIVSSLNHEIS